MNYLTGGADSIAQLSLPVVMFPISRDPLLLFHSPSPNARAALRNEAPLPCGPHLLPLTLSLTKRTGAVTWFSDGIRILYHVPWYWNLFTTTIDDLLFSSPYLLFSSPTVPWYNHGILGSTIEFQNLGIFQRTIPLLLKCFDSVRFFYSINSNNLKYCYNNNIKKITVCIGIYSKM